jgi:hypothetical protein
MSSVSLLLRYGMKSAPDDRAEMTSPSADRLLLMDCASRKRSAVYERNHCRHHMHAAQRRQTDRSTTRQQQRRRQLTARRR